MFPVHSLRSLFQDFFGGPKLVTGDQLGLLADSLTSARGGLVAAADGAQADATLLPAFASQVDVVAGAADSVVLPPAVAGKMVFVVNNTANAMQVFGDPSNPATGVGDTITAPASHAPIATGTGVSVASGVGCFFVCCVLGNWKQGAIS